MPQTVSNLIDAVRFNCPGAEDGAILFALRETIRDFCKRSEAWIDTIVADAIKSQKEYILFHSASSYPHRIIALYLEGSLVDQSIYAFNESKLTILDGFQPQKDIPNGLSAKCVIVPRLFQNQVNSDLLEKYGEYIVAGATSYLAQSPKKPYTDPNVFALFRQKYNEGITKALNNKARCNKLTIPSWRA